jgi:hypothetical protein
VSKPIGQLVLVSGVHRSLSLTSFFFFFFFFFIIIFFLNLYNGPDFFGNSRSADSLHHVALL